jgi:hypothetical protein
VRFCLALFPATETVQDKREEECKTKAALKRRTPN